MNRPLSDRNEEAAEKVARLKQLFLPYPPHVHLHSRFDYLQRLGRLTRGQPQMGMRVLAPSGSGKSAAAAAYIALVESRTPRRADFIPVIKVDLERAMTSKKLMTIILDAFGDPHSGHGNELMLKRRACACFERFQPELLIVNEIQHLNYRNGPKNDVTDTLKGLLDAGVVPMVFMGTEEAAGLFSRNLQLNGRLLAPCDLPPLDSRKGADRELFSQFVVRLEQAIVDQAILPLPSALHDADVLPALFEVSGGVIGRVSRLFQVAVEVAVRRGSDRLELADISWAIDHWAVEQSFIKQNPLKGMVHV